MEKKCQVLAVSRSDYYAWLRKPESNLENSNKILLKGIVSVCHNSRKTYGYPLITLQLNKEGISCSRNQVAKLMSKNGIRSKTKCKFKTTIDSKHDFPVAKNFLKQNFFADKPKQVWVLGIIYIPTGEGWHYLEAIVDLFNSEIVGWAMDKTMTRELVLKALKQAVGCKKPTAGLIHHSGQGKQCASFDYQQALKDYGIKPSMIRKDNCYDNACIESFFGALIIELIYGSRLKSRADARLAIFEYIEVFYVRIRLHSTLNYISPVEYELCFQRAA